METNLETYPKTDPIALMDLPIVVCRNNIDFLIDSIKKKDKWKKDFEAKLRKKLASFSDVTASCRNDFFLEDFYKKTLNWLNNFEKEILGDT